MIRLLARLGLLAVPVLVMIALIPIIQNDWTLLAVYGALVASTLLMWRDRRDVIFFFFGLITLSISELFFISTGVEVFYRDTLMLGMPIWLPVLWGYGFIFIHRGVNVLEAYLK